MPLSPAAASAHLHARRRKFAFVAGDQPSLLGGLLAAGFMATLGDTSWELTGPHWFFANFLGVCILCPFGLTVSLRQFAKLNLRKPLVRGGVGLRAWHW